MGLIALCIFWLMVVRLWIVVGLRQPLIFIAIWFLSGLILGLVGLAPLFSPWRPFLLLRW